MARAMAHNSSQPAGEGFSIFDDCSPSSKEKRTASTATTTNDVLGELSEGQSQSRAASIDLVSSSLVSPFTKSPRRDGARFDAKSTKCQALRLTPRAQRPQAHAETFEPLVAVPEEINNVLEIDTVTSAAQSPAKPDISLATPTQLCEEQHMLLTLEPKSSLEEQVEKHLSGQFEWIMTYPAGAVFHAAGGSVDRPNPRSPSTTRVYGCNVLPVRRRTTSETSAESSTDMYTLLATTLTKGPHHYPSMAGSEDMINAHLGQTCQLPPPPYPGTPLKVPEATTLVEQAVSPSLTVVSERSSSIMDGSSRTGSFSVPRIEDSLEELDRLEEELEAVHQVTRPRQIVSTNDESNQPSAGTIGKKSSTSASAKRLSIAGYSATVRVKPSQEKRPSLRRSASLTLRNQRTPQQSSSIESTRAEMSPPAKQSLINRLSTPRNPVKSTKPPTVPKFELPGEAVARRLKEQREARLAQQAEAQRAQAPPAPKPRSNKPLPRPTFELPGEAISRRKREEREAKLRAEEEEARKRREFKARPVRHSMGPGTLPRETLTSLARQGKPRAEVNGDPDTQQKGLSIGVARNNARVSSLDSLPHARGRHSGIFSTEASRATSTSTGSGGGKRNSVSVEELTVQRQRGREVLSKDNSYTQEKNKGKQEREMTAKTAREQAAERSRIASREWAEKKRRKELAAKQAKENMIGQNGGVSA